jgi:HAMP domain-containing protein
MIEFYNAYAPYLWAGLAAVVALLLVWLLALQVKLGRAVRRYDRVTRGVDGGTLQQILEKEIWRIQEATEKTGALETYYQNLAADLRRCVQRVGVVRFNPFQDIGGNQSFSIALLDAQGDGVVLTGMHGRNDTRFYVKPILSNGSTHDLSPEEQQAIQMAGATPAAVAKQL